MKRVTKKQALEALDSMDDFLAGMEVSVDPKGPRELLFRYIKEREAARKALKSMRKIEDGWNGITLR